VPDRVTAKTNQEGVRIVRTINQLIDTHGVDIDPHLDRQATVPILGGLQFQGDVAVIPAAMLASAETTMTPVPAAGIPVVRGEAGGNTHLLLADGPVFWAPAKSRDNSLDLGTVSVPDGSAAFLAHPEHGYSGIGPGAYVLRRQREQADEIRLVQD
jgi:hypothetical protein